MNIIQNRLVDSYVVLVLANMVDETKGMPIADVPEYKRIGIVDYPIRSEVEIIVAEKTIEAFS
ncbi:hypothetical protein [Paratissierella segnis]|uniref:Uncharacterized protein n=1 Tax=Paratissierella segnis TaxID=2763679 RepID=A0A926IKA9_9FIRM|nr:hypothetical protein [Paratissierella segnis]MBC8588105.1 hypothetical protein [Paratissierella segnis]